MSGGRNVTYGDITKAASRLKGKLRKTPLLEAPLLNTALGCRLLIKPECLQVTGSFKARGAFNSILQLDDKSRQKGVVAFSAGNHGQAVAYAAKLANVPCVIVMPKSAPQLKIDNTRGYCAEVILYDMETESREAIAERLSVERGLTLVPPFEAINTMAGQGTAGLEINEECKALGIKPDAVLIPCSGGGLVAGVTVAIHHAFPKAQIYAVEPELFDDTKRSLLSGKKEHNTRKTGSICDALVAATPGDMTFAIMKEEKVMGLTVSDEEALQGIAASAKHFKLALEPGGAVGIAAVITQKCDIKNKNIVVIASGGNADASLQIEALKKFSALV
jgi:threonine dehydratase